MESAEFLRLIRMPMPFGKYRGRPLLALPMAYLCWLERKGWPEGPLGTQLALIYELKLNGLDTQLYSMLEDR